MLRFLVFQNSAPVVTKAFYLIIFYSGLLLLVLHYTLGWVKQLILFCFGFSHIMTTCVGNSKHMAFI